MEAGCNHFQEFAPQAQTPKAKIRRDADFRPRKG
jgi:hypothetical protein